MTTAALAGSDEAVALDGRTSIRKKRLEITGTFDIECAEWDQFLLGVTCEGVEGEREEDGSVKKETKIWYDGDAMVLYLIDRGGVWFSHAGGVYDNLFVLDKFLSKHVACQIDRSQHRVSRIVAGKLTLRDSYSLWPQGLEKLCAAIGRPEPKLPWPCECGRDCGGYCRLTLLAREGDPDVEDYCRADAVSLYDAIVRLRDFAEDNGIELRGTIGRTAWICARTELGIPKSTIPVHLWRAIRQADKGGRGAIICPFSPAGQVGACYDICNAYPAALGKTNLPVGDAYQLGDAEASEALDRCRPGVYTLSVLVPEDSFLPPLPWTKRFRGSGNGLCFPTGEFTGTWVLPELIAAFERGVKILKVHSAITWEAEAPVFAPLVERWYEIRRSAGKKTPLGEWISRLSKALCGVLAMRPDRQRAVFFPEEIRLCTRRGSCRWKCTKRCGAFIPLDLFGKVWSAPYFKMADSAYPQWSAYLRALTRVQWLSQAERMGEVRACGACGADVTASGPDGSCPDHPDATISSSNGGRAVCFGNTDSLWTLSRQSPLPLGDGLGDWEYKLSFYDLEVRSLTNYAYRDLATDKLEIKGTPGLSEDAWRSGSGTIDRGIVTFGAAIGTNRGLFHRRSRKWSSPRRDRIWFGDRILQSNGITIPATAEQLREFAARAEEQREILEARDERLAAA